VLIGTQDMLLSRTLNRGYAAPRARWPMEFGLLNQDCLWVMDEVQLMDVGLATSAQLQAFREDSADNGQAMRPCRTWWMSATLQRGWLQKSPDTLKLGASLSQTAIPATKHTGHLWDDVHKPCRLEAVKTRRLCRVDRHSAFQNGRGLKANTGMVKGLIEPCEFEACKEQGSQGKRTALVHSRFRPTNVHLGVRRF